MRRYYKLLSWDYVTNRGLATDGTSWEGHPTTFDVYEDDLPPEYNGFLNINEVFTAVESPSRVLYDIVIEEGPRAARPAQTVRHIPLDDNAVEQIVNSGLSVDEQIAVAGAETSFLSPLEDRLQSLEQRVTRLEHRVENRTDDHR